MQKIHGVLPIHNKLSTPPKPNIRFMFCIACPAAPLRRLSRQETMTSRLPSFDEKLLDLVVTGIFYPDARFYNDVRHNPLSI